jgi:hypothetical protein
VTTLVVLIGGGHAGRIRRFSVPVLAHAYPVVRVEQRSAPTCACLRQTARFDHPRAAYGGGAARPPGSRAFREMTISCSSTGRAQDSDLLATHWAGSRKTPDRHEQRRHKARARRRTPAGRSHGSTPTSSSMVSVLGTRRLESLSWPSPPRARPPLNGSLTRNPEEPKPCNSV